MKDLETFLNTTYNQDKKNRCVYVDIDLDVYSDIYNEWDFSPWKKRDMDTGLFDYLLECSREISLKKSIDIRFHLPGRIENNEKERNVIAGIGSYFSYQLHKNTYERKKAFKSMLSYAMLGLAFLVFAVLLQGLPRQNAISTIGNEGLFIGSWVLFWECFSILFFTDRELRDAKRHLVRLKKANLFFEYHTKK